MAHHDDNPHGDSSHDGFHDESGFLTIFLGLVVMVGMTCLPATIGWVQLATGWPGASADHGRRHGAFPARAQGLPFAPARGRMKQDSRRHR